MNRFSKFSLVVLVGLVAVSGLVCGREHGGQPQYVFLICLDATRPDHLGCYGYRRNTSPRIDSLATAGVVYEDAVSQAPWTVPSVATILSSTFPCQHGARRTEGTRVAYSGVEHSFVQTLSEEGFKTAHFTGGLLVQNKIPAWELSQAALEWLRDNLDERCLIVIHHYDTHSPYVAAPDCIDRLDPGYQGPYKYRFGDFEVLKQARVGRLQEVLHLSPADIKHVQALYDCQIMRADRSIGMLVDSLNTWGRLDRTMMVIFADHGEEFLEHGSIDHGQTVHEETIRVPLIVFCPGLIKGPRRVTEQVGLIDIGPTLLDALDIEVPSYFEGRSLLPLASARGRVPGSETRPCGLPYTCLISEAIARRPEKKALRIPPWKLIFDPFFGASGLYNIAKDPYEQNNLADTYPDIVTELSDTLMVMEKYYPGGWCIAWSGDSLHVIRGRISVDSGLLEAVGHNILPEIDPDVDSLVISDDWTEVYFRSEVSPGWEGVEVRMNSPSDATFHIGLDPGPRPEGILGRNGDRVEFPIRLSPSQAAVRRLDLRKMYAATDAGVLIYWLEPGTDPAAKQQKEKELRRQMKALGYLE